MSESRINLIKKAFAKADRDGSGVVDVNDLKGVYNCREHPKYKSGEWTERQVLDHSNTCGIVQCCS